MVSAASFALLGMTALAETAMPGAPDPALLRGLMGQLAPQSDPLEFLKREAARVADCMRQVNQDELALLQARVDREARAVRELCLANRRDEAQRAAQRSAGDLLATPVVGELQRCDPLLGDLAGLLPWLGTSARFHVCDLEKTVPLPAEAP